MGCRRSILSKSCPWTQGPLTNHSQCHHMIFKLSKINTVLLLNTVFQRKLSVQTLISPKIFSMLYLYITLCIKIKFSPLSPMFFKMIVVGDIFHYGLHSEKPKSPKLTWPPPKKNIFFKIKEYLIGYYINVNLYYF